MGVERKIPAIHLAFCFRGSSSKSLNLKNACVWRACVWRGKPARGKDNVSFNLFVWAITPEYTSGGGSWVFIRAA